MFDFAWTEIALIAVVALIAIGPKDMPVAIRAVSGAIKKARRMAGEFQTHVDEMVREANLDEVRGQFTELRNFNLRGEIEKHIDPDGGLRGTLASNPMMTPIAPASAEPVSTGPLADQVGAVAIAERERPSMEAEPEPGTVRRAPAFIPPAIATPPAPPAFIPPNAARPTTEH